MENIFTCVFILSLTIMETVSKASDIPASTCEPLTSVYCQGLGYNYTASKWMSTRDQNEASFRIQTLLSALDSKCHHGLMMLLCTAYLPLCLVNKDAQVVIGPCRDMCQVVRASCEGELHIQGMSWPEELNCSHFLGGRNALCIELPAKPTHTAGGKTDLVTLSSMATTEAADTGTTPFHTTGKGSTSGNDTPITSASPSTQSGSTAPTAGTSAPPGGQSTERPSVSTTSRGRYEIFGIVTEKPRPGKSYNVKFSSCQCSCTGVTEIKP